MVADWKSLTPAQQRLLRIMARVTIDEENCGMAVRGVSVKSADKLVDAGLAVFVDWAECSELGEGYVEGKEYRCYAPTDAGRKLLSLAEGAR